MFNKYIFLFICIFINSCAHLSIKDCQEKNWEEIGIADGAAGKTALDMEKINSYCSKYQLEHSPEERYSRGYQRGLRQFCTHETGVRFGNNGAVLPSVCDPREFIEIGVGYQKGLKNFCTENQGKVTAEQGQKAHTPCKEDEHPAYYKGYQQGVRSYCANVPAAFEKGLNGQSPSFTCPADLRDAFEKAYAKGHKVKLEIDDINTKLKVAKLILIQYEQDQALIETQIKEKREKLSDNDVEIQRLNKILVDLSRRTQASEVSSFIKSDFADAQEKRARLMQENKRIREQDIEDLYQQRVLKNTEILQARDDVAYWERMLVAVKAKHLSTY